MGLHQTKKFLQSERNDHQNENVAYSMGEDIWKLCIW